MVPRPPGIWNSKPVRLRPLCAEVLRLPLLVGVLVGVSRFLLRRFIDSSEFSVYGFSPLFWATRVGWRREGR